MGRTSLNSRRKGLTHPVLRIRRGTQHVEIRAHFTRVAARVAARVPGVPGGALRRGVAGRSTCAKKLGRAEGEATRREVVGGCTDQWTRGATKSP